MNKQFKRIIDDYMDSNQRFAEDFEQLAEKLMKVESKQSMFVFSHELDINLVSNQNNNLMQCLVENEEMFSDFFEKRLNRKTKYLCQMRDKRIWFCLKYKNLPENRNLKTFKDLQRNTSQLFSMDCIQILSMSQTSKSMIGRRFEAKDSKEGQKSIKWCIKSIRETDFQGLSDNYKEDKDDRVFTEKRKILAKIGSNIGSKIGSNESVPIEIIVFMDIFHERELQCLYNGSHLEAVVLLKTEAEEYLLLSFDKIVRPLPLVINEFNQFLLQFPENLRGLYEDRKVSNYSFALSLAFVFGDNIAISGSFFRLKLGLLLSLLSLEEYPKKNHSSVLVLCDDTLMIRRLFEGSALFSQYHYLVKSVFIPLTGKSREDRRDNSLMWTDSGALNYGADGITIIGSVSNLNELPEKERTALFHALETNEVIAKQSQPSEPSLTEFELKTTIWAVIEDNTDEKQYRKSNRGQTILWTEVFGMVYRIPNTTAFQSYIYVRPDSEGTLSLDEWQQILDLMGGIRPRMTSTAEKLLQSYYVFSRRLRGPKLNQISLQTLISLSKSMAKLSLRLEVTKYDALMAVMIYEESLMTRLSEKESPLSFFVKPIFHVFVEDMHQTIGSNVRPKEFKNSFSQTLSQRTVR